MAIRKFVAPTTREAMMQVRRELGDDAVIIANRKVGNRIEILAAEPDAVDALVQRSETRAAAPAREVEVPSMQRDAARPKVEAFQDFVRRQMNAGNEPAQPARSARETPSRSPMTGDALARATARPTGNTAGVAMYHDVAEFQDEESMQPLPRETQASMRVQHASVAAPRRSGESARDERARAEPRFAQEPAQFAAPRPSHRAQQVESVAQAADAAVFRRRPAQVAPRTDFAGVAAQPRVPAAPLPIDIVLEPLPVAQPVAAAPTQPARSPLAQPSVTVADAAVPSGHAPVPQLPVPQLPVPQLPVPQSTVRSQAAPIAVAARLREASLKAAAQTAAMQAERQVAPVAAEQPAQPIEAQAVVVQPATVVAAPAALQVAAPLAVAVEQPVASVAPQAVIAATTLAEPVAAPQVAAPATQASTKRAPMAPMWSWETRLGAAPTAQDHPEQQPQVVHATVAAPVAAPIVHAQPAEPRVESQLLAELQSMRDMLREQMATLATKPAPEAMPSSASATRVMTRLLTAGFSAEVARRIAAHVPQDTDVAQVDGWLHEVLAHNIRCADASDGIVERSGRPATPGQTVALVGPTGVGKTTTVAKLAARFAVRHGTTALGLITLDAYRVAAPEQLRAYGRILGTPVHLAQDSATLRELLSTMVHKRLVLIDTCGVSQRDERLGEMLDMLAGAGTPNRPVQRVLLMNSASHAETLDETARAWRAHECTGAILTKLDEATRIGGSLDVSLRHRLTLLGLTNGQRVPEDWHAASNKLLAHFALKPAAQLFELADDEGAALIRAQAAQVVAHGALHG